MEKYEGQKDVTLGLAELDLQDDAHNSLNRLKYMKQLVCKRTFVVNYC